MEGSRSASQSSDLLRKTRELVRSILEDLSCGRSPLISIERFRNYCTNSHGECNCSYDKPIGEEILTIRKENHVHRIDVLLRVLLIVQQLLLENKHGSKRDIYYMHPLAFSDQSVVDRAINDICILLQCSRHNLNVVSVGKGLVMGWLRFFEAGTKYDCIRSPSSVHPIPVLVEDVKDIVSVAQYILVVEKESVFQRLANDQFCKTNRCIVITGRGYPDVPTRRFLRLLTETLPLPVYCLVDCDPYGFDILATYCFGSMQMAYDAKFLRVPNIHWLGAFPSDSEKYSLPQQCLLPLTAEDKKRTEAMLLRCYLHQEAPHWRLELEKMLQRGVKFEIEALSVHSLSFLSDVYLPSKIQTVAFSQTCVLKVKLDCQTCRMKVMEVLQALRGNYSVNIDGEKGTVNISGRVISPRMVLRVFDKYNQHGEVVSVKFEAEQLPNPYFYGGLHNMYNMPPPPHLAPYLPPELPWYDGYHHGPRPPMLPLPPPHLMPNGPPRPPPMPPGNYNQCNMM